MPRTEKANQQIREETTDKILNAARRVFAHKGSAGTMAEVAADAGISQGLAYRYFRSKDAIFTALVRESTRPSDEINARVQQLPGTPGTRLRHVVSTMVERRQKIPEFYQFLDQALRDEELPDDLRVSTRRQGMAAREILRPAQRAHPRGRRRRVRVPISLANLAIQ